MMMKGCLFSIWLYCKQPAIRQATGLKRTMKHSNGRRSMETLRRNFSGEGNATRNLAEDERLNESLHYKSERAMSFDIFLTQC